MSMSKYSETLSILRTVNWKNLQIKAKQGLDEINRKIEHHVRKMDDSFSSAGYVFDDPGKEEARMKDVGYLNYLENSADKFVTLNNGIHEIMEGLGLSAANSIIMDEEEQK